MRYLLLASFFLLMGCSDLILRDSDSGSATTGKVAARVVLCPLTLCMSELGLAAEQEREEASQQAATVRRAHFDTAYQYCKTAGAANVHTCMAQSGYRWEPRGEQGGYRRDPCARFTDQVAHQLCQQNATYQQQVDLQQQQLDFQRVLGMQQFTTEFAHQQQEILQRALQPPVDLRQSYPTYCTEQFIGNQRIMQCN